MLRVNVDKADCLIGSSYFGRIVLGIPWVSTFVETDWDTREINVEIIDTGNFASEIRDRCLVSVIAVVRIYKLCGIFTHISGFWSTIVSRVVEPLSIINSVKGAYCGE